MDPRLLIAEANTLFHLAIAPFIRLSTFRFDSRRNQSIFGSFAVVNPDRGRKHCRVNIDV